MLSLTNVQVDHVARQCEDAIELLRAMARDEQRRGEAMRLISDRNMATYHATRAELILLTVASLQETVAAFRARRPPLAPEPKRRPVPMPAQGTATVARRILRTQDERLGTAFD